MFRTRFGCAYPDQFLSWSARGCGGTWAKLGYAIAIGFASGYVATGTFRRGVIGAFSAGITMGIANAGNLSAWQRVGLQATTGGVVESLSGGKFGHGFVSAGVTASVMPQVGHIGNDAARTVVGALVGGTLSKATGGKFANGAISGAIQGAMAKRAAPSRSARAMASEGADSKDGTEGAPDELKPLMRDPATRQLALRRIAGREIPWMAYKRQMDSDTFSRTPTWYQNGIRTLYRDAQRQSVISATGACRSLETCE